MPFVMTPAGRISYTVIEPADAVGDSPALLMIMGLAGSGAMWWRLAPYVTRRYRAIVFDNRGTGRSSPLRTRLTMSDLVRDALAVLDGAGIERVHVLGASMGGMIAQHLALDHRHRVRSLVLACTTAGGRREPPNLRVVASVALRPLIGPERSFRLLAPALYSPRTRIDRRERMREDMGIRLSDRVGTLTAWRQSAAIAGHDTRARLHELDGLPTLVLHGLDDHLISPERGRELARLIPGSRFAEIADAGHMLVTDAEQKVAAAVIDHLDQAAAL
jgi:3-oxoadipate enol-lactonase